MPKLTIFVGSSTASRRQAQLLIKDLTAPTIIFLPWWDTFTTGRTLLEELDTIRNNIQAAIMVFSPDFPGTVRGNSVALVNQNVMFEFGYLTGALGRNKVAMIRYGDFYLPSDLQGYIHINGGSYFKAGNAVPASKKTKQEFGRWFEQI